MEGFVRRFIGIDLALTETGFASLSDGRISLALIGSKSSENATNRKFSIVDRILRLVQPFDIVTIEDFSMVGKYAVSGKAPERIELLGMLRYALVRSAGCSVLTVHPARLKQFITGNGRATKEEVIIELAKRWHIVTTHDDLADAASLALFGYYLFNGFDSDIIIDGYGTPGPSERARVAFEKEFAANRRWLCVRQNGVTFEASGGNGS